MKRNKFTGIIIIIPSDTSVEDLENVLEQTIDNFKKENDRYANAAKIIFTENDQTVHDRLAEYLVMLEEKYGTKPQNNYEVQRWATRFTHGALSGFINMEAIKEIANMDKEHEALFSLKGFGFVKDLCKNILEITGN